MTDPTPDGWHGDADLAHLLVPIDAVAPHPENPRQGDVGAMTMSLERFGQYRPAVVAAREAGPDHIVAGSHMWKAAKALGWTHLAVLRRDLPDDEARQLMLADNRVADRGSYDQDALAALLRTLAEADQLHPATGYDLDDLDDLLADLGRVPVLPGAAPGERPERAPTPPVAPDEDTAPAPPGYRSVQLMIPQEDWGWFSDAVGRLREHRDLDTVAAVVMAVVREASAAIE